MDNDQDDDYDEAETNRRMVGDVMFVAGTEVQEHHFTEEGVHTVRTTPWWDYWPSGTLVTTHEGEVIGFKIGTVWLDVTGDQISNFSQLINGPRMVFMDDAQIDALWSAYVDLTKVRGRFALTVEDVRSGLVDTEAETE